MLTATVLMMLHASPAFLTEGTPRSVRLVADEVVSAASYESMSREELQLAYDAIEAKRPGTLVPAMLGFGGGIAAVTLTIALFGAMSGPFGIAVYLAVILTVGIVVSLGLAALGIVLYVRNGPARAAAKQQLDLIEAAYRDGRCRNEPEQRPCLNDPKGPPSRRERVPTSPPPSGFIPQVQAPGPVPSFVLASF